MSKFGYTGPTMTSKLINQQLFQLHLKEIYFFVVKLEIPTKKKYVLCH